MQSLYERAHLLSSGSDTDFAAAYDLLCQAAEQQDPRALYALSSWFMYGRHVEVDPMRAFELALAASNLGHAEATYCVAVSYEGGIGTRRNRKRAFQAYFKGAMLGDESCIFELGRCYFYGVGIPADKRLAETIGWVCDLRHIDRAEVEAIKNEAK